MNIIMAKDAVIQAGKQLVKKGLIARTWGNVSCRFSEDKFLITPSGRPYETLTIEDIVAVNISDLSYSGDVEPSSEKGVHAAIYRERNDVNFVIHTHQHYASALSPLKMDIPVTDPIVGGLVGKRIVSIPYGLSGTKKLIKNVSRALAAEGVKAFLMVSHGALVFGQNSEEAFCVADELEKLCARFIKDRYLELSGRSGFDPHECSSYILNLNSGDKADFGLVEPSFLCNSERRGFSFMLYPACPESDYFPQGSQEVVEVSLDDQEKGRASYLMPAISLHREIYKRYREVKALIHTRLPDVLTVSRLGQTVLPYLDDFAQIIGHSVPSMDITGFEESKKTTQLLAHSLRGRSAIFLAGNGAICCGQTKGDAQAAVMVLDKNCKALIASLLFDRGKPLNSLECRLMRYIYLKRYARKASPQ